MEQEQILYGPIKLGFTPQGAEEMVNRNQRLKKCTFLDSSEHFGVEIPQISSKALQKMAMGGSISRVERVVNAFASQRTSVMDMTRYLGYAFLYRQFENRLWEIYLQSDILTQWNRAYPRMTIVSHTRGTSPAFLMLITKAQEQILAYKQETLQWVQVRIQNDPKALPEEKKSQILQAIRYLNAIDPLVWLIMSVSKDKVAADHLHKDVRNLLGAFVMRSELPEYLALMLAELLVIVGNVTSMGLSAPLGLGDNHSPVYLSYELGSLKKNTEERTRMRLVLGNNERDFTELKAKLDATSPTGRQKSLASYMGQVKNQDLGLMYLSYVQEACQHMNIHFDSFVNHAPHSRQTMININLTL